MPAPDALWAGEAPGLRMLLPAAAAGGGAIFPNPPGGGGKKPVDDFDLAARDVPSDPSFFYVTKQKDRQSIDQS